MPDFRRRARDDGIAHQRLKNVCSFTVAALTPDTKTAAWPWEPSVASVSISVPPFVS